MLYPILPVFLTGTLGATATVVGIIDGFAQAVQNVVRGFSGYFSDKLQKRKGIALVGYALAALTATGACRPASSGQREGTTATARRGLQAGEGARRDAAGAAGAGREGRRRRVPPP